MIVLLDCFLLTFLYLKLPQHFSLDTLLTHTNLSAGGRLYSPHRTALGGDVRVDAWMAAGQCKTLYMAVYHNGKACNWSICIIPRTKRSTAIVARTSPVSFVVCLFVCCCVGVGCVWTCCIPCCSTYMELESWNRVLVDQLHGWTKLCICSM